jgi:hypothetical protein
MINDKKYTRDAVRQTKRDDQEEIIKNLVVRLNPTEITDKNITVEAINYRLGWHKVGFRGFRSPNGVEVW